MSSKNPIDKKMRSNNNLIFGFFTTICISSMFCSFFSLQTFAMENDVFCREELFLKIVSNLSRQDKKNCALVCKNWHRVSENNDVNIANFRQQKDGLLSYCCFKDAFCIIENNNFESSCLIKINGQDLKMIRIDTSSKLDIASFAIHETGVFFLENQQVKFLRDDGTTNILYKSEAKSIHCIDDNIVLLLENEINIFNLQNKSFNKVNIIMTHVAGLEKDFFLFNDVSSAEYGQIAENLILATAVPKINVQIRAAVGSKELMIKCYQKRGGSDLLFEKIFYIEGKKEDRKNVRHLAINCTQAKLLKIKITSDFLVQKLLLNQEYLFVIGQLPTNVHSSLLIYFLSKDKIIHDQPLKKLILDAYVVGNHFFYIAKSNNDFYEIFALPLKKILNIQ